jgi:hypothetical protein
VTPELWTKQVALAASLWEALKRDLPFLGGHLQATLTRKRGCERWWSEPTVIEALKNNREFELDPDGNAEWLRGRATRKF